MPCVLTLTDPHIRVAKPEGRTDSEWLDVCLGQIEQAFAIAKRTECSAVLCSGDLGDSPNWSPKAIVGFMQIVKQYDIPFVTTLGQHDVFGHNIDTWKHTSVGVLAEAGVIQVLRHGEYLLIDEEIGVYGFAFGEYETDELLKGTWMPPEAHKNRFKIALVHASVGPTEAMGWAGIEHQNIRNVDLASFGDIHCGFDPYEFKSGAIAYSTGSLTRGSRADIGRMPMVAVVTVNDDWNMDFEEVPDGDDEDVFVIDAASETVGDTADAFKKVLMTALDFRDETPSKRIQRVGEEHAYSPRQISLVLERLETGNE
jgi:DNA repair exonuclease SbcCD nuclease subunit